MEAPQVEGGETARFVSYLFRYADEGTWVSLRGFPNKPGGGKPVIKSVVINGHGLDAITSEAVAMSELCFARGQGDAGYVFAPPIVTFDNPMKADGESIANGLCLSVECDQFPQQALATLQALLGPPTVIVESGGECEGDFGEIFPKLHIHWRLKEPARKPDDFVALTLAREMMAKLVKSDTTAIPPVHPLRWPGSVHTKARPRACRIIGGEERAEVELADALEAILEACEAAGVKRQANGKEHVPGEPETDIRDIADAMLQIPNLCAWDGWTKFGMAIHRATGAEGFDIFDQWSRRSSKYDPANTAERWEHWHKHPATKLGAGSIIYWASVHNPKWQRPSHKFKIFEEMPPGTHGRKSRLPIVWFKDVMPSIDVLDFVEDVLCEGQMSVVYGESNCGKTFFMTDVGLHVAWGKSWRGKQVEKGGVIYCALEGGHGIKNRIAAFRKAQGLMDADIPFAIVPITMNMLDPNADTPHLIELIKEAAITIAGPVKLVVIDTLARAMGGGNENAPDDMGAMVNNVDQVRQATGAHVTFVHHSGKDQARGARGHSSLRAATDTEIEIVKNEVTEISVATVTKQRELEIKGAFPFTLKQVDLGTNRRGKPVTSCIVIEADIDSSVMKPNAARATPKEFRALEVLQNVFTDYGVFAPKDRNIPNVTVIKISQFRDALRNAGVTSDTAERMQWIRIKDGLDNKGFIRMSGDFLWRP